MSSQAGGIGQPICSADPTTVRVGDPDDGQSLGTGSLHRGELAVTVVPIDVADGAYEADALFRWLVPATQTTAAHLDQMTARLTITVAGT